VPAVSIRKDIVSYTIQYIFGAPSILFSLSGGKTIPSKLTSVDAPAMQKCEFP